jgi:hypothetical protein
MEKDITCTIQEYHQIKKNIRDNNLPIVIKGKPKKVGRIVYVKLVGDDMSINKAISPQVQLKEDFHLLSRTLIYIVLSKIAAFVQLYLIFWIVNFAFNVEVSIFIPLLLSVFMPIPTIPKKTLKISKKYSNF